VSRVQIRATALKLAVEYLRGRSIEPGPPIKVATEFEKWLLAVAPAQKPRVVSDTDAEVERIAAVAEMAPLAGHIRVPAHLDKPVSEMTQQEKLDLRKWARQASISDIVGDDSQDRGPDPQPIPLKVVERPDPLPRDVAVRHGATGGTPPQGKRVSEDERAEIRARYSELKKAGHPAPAKTVQTEFGISPPTFYRIMNEAAA
jgi:hypothetical protein